MSFPIRGTAVATFNNTIPITMVGEWNATIAVPVTRHYGQGNGDPGSGYVGSAIGTKRNGSGSFTFAVDQTGAEIQRIIQLGVSQFFTIDFPLGDPNQGAPGIKLIDCHFDSLQFGEDNPEGKFLITGSMSCGDVQGDVFDAAA